MSRKSSGSTSSTGTGAVDVLVYVAGDRARIGDVDPDRPDHPLAVELVGVGPDLVDEDVAGVHVGAKPRELDRDGTPDAARRAGDDDALTWKGDQHGGLGELLMRGFPQRRDDDRRHDRGGDQVVGMRRRR